MHNYIVIRKDQEESQRVLQALHAALIARSTSPDDHLVFAMAKDEAALSELSDKLEDMLRPYRYYEGDEGAPETLNSVTFCNVHPEQRRHFRKLESWRPQKILSAIA